MLKDWLKNQLTPEKRESEVYVGFVEALQKLVEDYVEPTLERILERRSFFTMQPQDLEIRMAELGRFFRIMTRSQASKPIILQQRLDEIHYKGSYQPIQATIRRELNNLPATWAPLYAPKDQTKYPYGDYFTDESTLSVDVKTYGDFFMTSRGKIKIPLNILYERYSGQDQAALVTRLTEEFDDVIRPLIPLHIVFDGFMFYLEFTVQQRGVELIMLGAEATVRIDDAFKARPEHMSGFQINNVFPGQTLPQIPRPTATEILRFDTMPIDAWALDLIQPPAILPLSAVPDKRYRESTAHNIEIDTLDLFGIQVALVGGEMRMYTFPAGATTFEVPIPWADVKTVEKITYRFF
ncbi:TPA: phage tail protein [Enterobacter hormaechei subsp. xiangfangensis]|nr:phage tail protein [Enterobacter hormaechei subsp. xiangfangensis]HAV1890622.1 phage tail protein [Enterobacter hormaechei subsp. xiangfangensis]